MKKAGKFIALFLLLVCVPCWTGALNFYSTCGGLDIDDLEGVIAEDTDVDAEVEKDSDGNPIMEGQMKIEI